MADKVFQKVRLVGCSADSLEKAIEGAVKQAGDHGVASWFEVVELRGAVNKGKVAEWQATVEEAFRA